MIEHGKYTINVEDTIITVTFEGMFNELASKNLCAQVEKLITDFSGNRFSMIINLLDYEGSTPDAHKEGDRHAHWLEGQNCQGKAIIASERAMLEIIRHEQKSLGKSTIESRVFKTDAEAKAWLLSL